MRERFAYAEEEEVPFVDVAGLADRLDRADILLLKEFYHTRLPYPNDTIWHFLKVLVDKLKRGGGPLAKLSYSSIRHRLENLVALGVLRKIPITHPAIYYPLDIMAESVRRIILLFAADSVGIGKRDGGG